MAKKYPMTYEEFEKRVIELLVRDTTPEEKEKLMNDLDDLLAYDPKFIKNLYRSSCGYYDSGHLNWDKIFNNPLLLSGPVNTIEMSL